MSEFGLSVVTGGLYPDVNGRQTSLITGGLSPVIVAQLGIGDTSPSLMAKQGKAISAAITLQLGGVPSVVTPSIGIPLGGTNTPFDLTNIIQNPTSLTGQQVYNPSGSTTASFTNNAITYTGSDLRIIIDLVPTATTSTNPPSFKQLIECTTFTVSIHREKSTVRAAGYINPKGFARGRRTIAGTMVLTQYTVDTLYSFLKDQQVMGHDVSADTLYVKGDQLPPFNMTLLFADEYGNASFRRVLGVDFVTDGVVYSSNDMLSEQTISYMASDFTPLMDINTSSLFRPNVTSQIFARKRTVQSVLSAGGTDNPSGIGNTPSSGSFQV